MTQVMNRSNTCHQGFLRVGFRVNTWAAWGPLVGLNSVSQQMKVCQEAVKTGFGSTILQCLGRLGVECSLHPENDGSNGTNGNHGFEAIPSKSPWCRCWNLHPSCLVIESHVAYIEYVFLRIPNDLSGWWFGCRDVGEGINVLNPMPWTIRVTSHLMPFEGHVASFQNAGYTQVHGPFFAGGVDGITLLPKVPKQYLMIIPIS